MIFVVIAVHIVGESFAPFILLIHMPMLPLLVVPCIGLLMSLYKRSGSSLLWFLASVATGVFLLQPRWSPPMEIEGKSGLGVMTLNMFDARRGVNEFFAAINEFNPEILFLQEATVLRTDSAIRRRLEQDFQVFITDNIAICSKLSFEETSVICFDELLCLSDQMNRRKFAIGKSHHQWVQIAKIRWKGQFIHVVNTHLSPLSYSPENSSWIGHLGMLSPKGAYRIAQAEELQRQISNLDGPLIFGGDLNTPPYGKVYKELSNGLTDSWKAVGFGTGWTITSELPYIRYDHLFCNKLLEPVRARVGEVLGSDHRSYFAEFELKRSG